VRKCALVAREHPQRSIRIFLPFRPTKKWAPRLFYPKPCQGTELYGFQVDYTQYLQQMKVPCIEYVSKDALAAKLKAWEPDIVLQNQPLNLGMPERTGFLYHGIPWKAGRGPIVHHTVTQWDGWCKLHLVSESKTAEALVSGGIPKERVFVPGLCHNDYILSLDREKMRAELCATLGVSKDTFLVLFAGNVWYTQAPLEHHYTILDWLAEYANSADNVRIIVKPKTLRFRSRGNAERVIWAESAPMIFDYFGADAMVSMPVGTTLADACVADMPVVMAEIAKGDDEMEAIEHDIGPVATSREELFEALDGMRENPQAHALGRASYLERMYPAGFFVPTWERALDCVDDYLAKRRGPWRVDSK